TMLLAVLISGVLLDGKDMPMPNYRFALINADSWKVIKAETDKDGKFQVDLAPGVYRHDVETIRVDKSTPKMLKLVERAHVLTPRVIQGIQGDILPRGPQAE